MKKNTIENMTKEQAIDFLREYAKCGIHHNYTEPENKLKKMGECIAVLTASGSVAAPKEEEKPLEKPKYAGDDIAYNFALDDYYTSKGKSSDRYIPTNETDYNKVCASLREMVRGANKELATLRQQLKEREEALKELLPLIEESNRLSQECIMDYDEVKFCPIRQGEGNQCRHCFDKAIIEKARKTLNL